MRDYDEVSICLQGCPRTDCMGNGLSDCDCVAACLEGTSLVLRQAADRVAECGLEHVAGECP